MQGLGTAAVIGLGIWSFYHPETGSWIYIALFVALFQGVLLARLSAGRSDPVPPEAPPYHFSAAEADLVRRHRFAFKHPAAAQGASSMLAAMGLVGLLLSPWLAYRLQWTQAAVIGLDIFVVGWITRRLNPRYVLVLAAHRGSEKARRDIEAFNGAWRKIFAAQGSGSQNAGQAAQASGKDARLGS